MTQYLPQYRLTVEEEAPPIPAGSQGRRGRERSGGKDSPRNGTPSVREAAEAGSLEAPEPGGMLTAVPTSEAAGGEA